MGGNLIVSFSVGGLKLKGLGGGRVIASSMLLLLLLKRSGLGCWGMGGWINWGVPRSMGWESSFS